MTGRKAFDDVDDEDELEQAIRKGRQLVNVNEVENEEVRLFIRSCLRIFETKSRSNSSMMYFNALEGIYQRVSYRVTANIYGKRYPTSG